MSSRLIIHCDLLIRRVLLVIHELLPALGVPCPPLICVPPARLSRDMTLAPGLLFLSKHLISGPLPELAIAFVTVLVVVAALAEDAATIHQRIRFYDVS